MCARSGSCGAGRRPMAAWVSAMRAMPGTSGTSIPWLNPRGSPWFFKKHHPEISPPKTMVLVVFSSNFYGIGPYMSI